MPPIPSIGWAEAWKQLHTRRRDSDMKIPDDCGGDCDVFIWRRVQWAVHRPELSWFVVDHSQQRKKKPPEAKTDRSIKLTARPKAASCFEKVLRYSFCLTVAEI